MDMMEVMKARQSVRQYSGRKIESEIRGILTGPVCQRDGGGAARPHGNEPAEILYHT